MDSSGLTLCGQLVCKNLDNGQNHPVISYSYILEDFYSSYVICFQGMYMISNQGIRFLFKVYDIYSSYNELWNEQIAIRMIGAGHYFSIMSARAPSAQIM